MTSAIKTPFHFRGFTLIELLATIAIIAVLAGLLLPGLATAKTSAKLTKCKSNLRQIGLALTLYVHDFGAYAPAYTPRGDDFKSWLDLIEPYLAGRMDTTGSRPAWLDPIFTCPVGRGQGTYGYNQTGVDSLPAPIPPPPGLKHGELGLGGVVPDYNSPLLRVPQREARVLVPSDMLAIGDLGQRMPEGYVLPVGERIGFGLGAVFESLEQERSLVAATKKRHNARSNMVFCDGHVEGLKYLQLYSNQEDQLRRWNADHQPHRNLVPTKDIQP